MAQAGKRVRTEQRPRRSRGRISSVRLVLIAVFGVVFVISAVMYGRSVAEGKREQGAFDELAQMLAESDGENTLAMDENESKLVRYSQLQQQYPDFTAWLYVPGTDVNYPVMYTPDEPDYYLRRAFDGSGAQSGTPFLGAGCDVNSDCVLVYGHNMYNGTMFASLERYKEESFAAENGVICFDTTEEVRTYTVFAAVECYILSGEEEGLRYYDYAGDLSDEQYQEIVSWLTEESLYDLGNVPENGEQIIILSTCSYHTDDGRFLVAGYLNEEA